MSIHILKKEAEFLGIHHDLLQNIPQATLRSMITQKKKELIEKFPPGTFIDLDSNLHLIKRYEIAKQNSVPDRFFTHSYVDGKQRNPTVSALTNAVNVEVKDATERKEAEFWKARHDFSTSAQKFIVDIAHRKERLMIDRQYIGRMAQDFLDRYWPLQKGQLVETVTEELVEDFIRGWMKDKEKMYQDSGTDTSFMPYNGLR